MRKREATSPPCSGYPFSRPPRHEGGAHMPDDRCRLGSDDVIIGLDLASAEHQAVVLTVAGQRLTRFRIPHTRAGLENLLRRTTPAALGRAGLREVLCLATSRACNTTCASAPTTIASSSGPTGHCRRCRRSGRA